MNIEIDTDNDWVRVTVNKQLKFEGYAISDAVWIELLEDAGAKVTEYDTRFNDENEVVVRIPRRS